MWWEIASAAMSVLGSASSGNKEAKAMANQSINENKQIIRGNDALVKANVANTIRTGYRVGLANLQRGLQKRQEVQQGFGISKAGTDALGQASANAAASGSIGASADAVLNDIHMKVGEAQAELQNQSELNTLNYNTQLSTLAMDGEAAIRSDTLEPTTGKIPSQGDIWGNALAVGVSSFATSYLSSKMKLGLGDKP